MFSFIAPFPPTSHTTPFHPQEISLPQSVASLRLERLFLAREPWRHGSQEGNWGARQKVRAPGSPCLGPAGLAWRGDSVWSPHALRWAGTSLGSSSAPSSRKRTEKVIWGVPPALSLGLGASHAVCGVGGGRWWGAGTARPCPSSAGPGQGKPGPGSPARALLPCLRGSPAKKSLSN